jgi:hypothetical protein
LLCKSDTLWKHKVHYKIDGEPRYAKLDRNQLPLKKDSLTELKVGWDSTRQKRGLISIRQN